MQAQYSTPGVLGMEESYDHTNFLVHSNVSSLVQVRAFGRRVPQASATIF
jgi:hypothetical protein